MGCSVHDAKGTSDKPPRTPAPMMFVRPENESRTCGSGASERPTPSPSGTPASKATCTPNQAGFSSSGFTGAVHKSPAMMAASIVHSPLFKREPRAPGVQGDLQG